MELYILPLLNHDTRVLWVLSISTINSHRAAVQCTVKYAISLIVPIEWDTISCSRRYPDSAVEAIAYGQLECFSSLKKEEAALEIRQWDTLIRVQTDTCSFKTILFHFKLVVLYMAGMLFPERATWPWKVYVLGCPGAIVSDKELLCTPTETHRGPAAR